MSTPQIHRRHPFCMHWPSKHKWLRRKHYFGNVFHLTHFRGHLARSRWKVKCCKNLGPSSPCKTSAKSAFFLPPRSAMTTCSEMVFLWPVNDRLFLHACQILGHLEHELASTIVEARRRSRVIMELFFCHSFLLFFFLLLRSFCFIKEGRSLEKKFEIKNFLQIRLWKYWIKLFLIQNWFIFIFSFSNCTAIDQMKK